MYPNTALSAWQLAIMAVVPVTALAVWLIAIFLAAREPRRDRAAAVSGGTARTAVASMTGAGTDELEPPRQAAGQKAA
jgi:membrane protein implicated in regulation of membrane protease activity